MCIFSLKFRFERESISRKHPVLPFEKFLKGQVIHSQDYSNTYYHPLAAHITKKNRLFSGQVYVRCELYNSLNDDQRNYVNTLNSLNIFFK